MEFIENAKSNRVTCLLQYGVPLDNRADFTKTDWEMWVAAMEDDTVVCTLLMLLYKGVF